MSKPHTCKECNKRFTSSRAVKQHHEAVHLTAGERQQRINARKTQKIQNKYKNVSSSQIKFVKHRPAPTPDPKKQIEQQNRIKKKKEQQELDQDTFSRGR